MVRIFSRFQGYRRLHSVFLDPKECLKPKAADPGGATAARAEARGAVGVDAIAACSLHGHGIEFELEFKPIEHPLEPNDEDQPVKCPMPNSSVLNDGAARKERAAETLRKRADISEMNEEEDGMVIDIQPPAQAVRKRHQTLARDHIGVPSFPAQLQNDSKILQMLRECNEFES